MKPALVWLLMVPVFNIAWNFWVFPGLSKSFQAYFRSVPDPATGSSAIKIARWVCWCGVLSLIPFLVWLAAPAYLILLMVYLLRAIDLKRKIKAL